MSDLPGDISSDTKEVEQGELSDSNALQAKCWAPFEALLLLQLMSKVFFALLGKKMSHAGRGRHKQDYKPCARPGSDYMLLRSMPDGQTASVRETSGAGRWNILVWG